MDYIRIADVSEFEKQSLKSFKVFGRSIAVLKKGEGQYEAIEATCKHQGADLTKGSIDGWVVTCPRHGWQYDLESGHCLNHESLPLKKYGVRLQGTEIHVSFLPLEE